MNNARDLQALYRQTVLDHSRHPRNFLRLEPADRVVVGHNPLCGDKLTLYLRLEDDRIENLAFEGTGCAISMASASIMTESVKHHALDDAQREVDQIMRQFEASDPDEAAVEGDMAQPSCVISSMHWCVLYQLAVARPDRLFGNNPVWRKICLAE